MVVKPDLYCELLCLFYRATLLADGTSRPTFLYRNGNSLLSSNFFLGLVAHHCQFLSQSSVKKFICNPSAGS